MKGLLVILVLAMSGCSVAGPYVTSISSDGRGGLNIQRGYTRYNYFLGVIDNTEAGQSNIQVIPKK